MKDCRPPSRLAERQMLRRLARYPEGRVARWIASPGSRGGGKEPIEENDERLNVIDFATARARQSA